MGQISDARRYVCLSDVHLPSEHKACVRAVCDFMRDFKPHGIILAGDILDLEEISTHNAQSVALLEGKRFAQTFAAGNAFLDLLERAWPKADERHWIEGNHEFRIDRWLDRGDHAVFKGDPLFSIPKRLDLAKRKYRWHGPYGTRAAHVKLGHLLITHGEYTGPNAAARTMAKWGCSTLSGHLHTPQVNYASGLDNQRASFVQGHLADAAKPALAYGKPPNTWRNGFSTIWLKKSGTFQVTLQNFWGDRLFVNDTEYSGGAK